MKHTEKIKIARKLRSKVEAKSGVPIFQSKGWEARKEGIKKRIKNQHGKINDRKRMVLVRRKKV